MASVVISDIINRSWYYWGARWRLSFWWSVSRSFHKSMHWQSHEKTFLSISMTFLRHYIEFLPVYIVSRHLLWQYQLYAKKLWYTKAWSCIVFCKEQWDRNLSARSKPPILLLHMVTIFGHAISFFYLPWLSHLFKVPMGQCQRNLKQAAQYCYPSILLWKDQCLNQLYRP